MRKAIKTVSGKHRPFTPTGYEGLDENAKEIKDRPLVIMGRPLNREDRLNVQSLLETKNRAGEAGTGQVVISNIGTVARYIWNTCVSEVKNVLAEEGTFDSVKGDEKNRLFDAEGFESDVTQAIAWIQEISQLSEAEAKN